jgi:dUTP pyrophosphatase
MTNHTNLYVKKLHIDAILPQRKSAEAAGYDISALYDVSIDAYGTQLVSTGLSFTVPSGTYGQLAPRSGLSCKGVHVGAGVIDRDYTGEVKVLLFNLSGNEIHLKATDRIAQLIIKKIETPIVVEVDELRSTERGDGGFGSTGG